MQITTIGLDLAKNVFQVHGMMRPARLWFASRFGGGRCCHFLPSCSLVGIKACGTSHHWARELIISVMRCG